MWPFSKKSLKTPKVPKADDWTLGEGERDGFPMIVRMANAYSGLAPIPGYDHHLIITVHARDPQPNGYPSSTELDELEAFEEGLSLLLEIGGDCLCVLVVTNNGLRDFIYYTRSVENAKRKIEEAPALFGSFVTETYVEPDEEWWLYKHFSESLIPDEKSSTANE